MAWFAAFSGPPGSSSIKGDPPPAIASPRGKEGSERYGRGQEGG
jgi:hypothetical protein